MEKTGNEIQPWVSFCMSTFKRPALLKTQLSSLLQQTLKDFEIVVSDNDPDSSAREVVSEFNDNRVKYFSNKENLGMINSFNKSIERSLGEFKRQALAQIRPDGRGLERGHFELAG